MMRLQLLQLLLLLLHIVNIWWRRLRVMLLQLMLLLLVVVLLLLLLLLLLLWRWWLQRCYIGELLLRNDGSRYLLLLLDLMRVGCNLKRICCCIVIVRHLFPIIYLFCVSKQIQITKFVKKRCIRKNKRKRLTLFLFPSCLCFIFRTANNFIFTTLQVYFSCYYPKEKLYPKSICVFTNNTII